MNRGPLYQHDFRPQFSGHQTFPLRYGWLKKAYDRVSETKQNSKNKTLCWGDDAIARFGVGKNMVASIRHWSSVVGVIKESSRDNRVETTEFGDFLFGEQGLDPYLEHPTSLWLIHWNLATSWRKKTTWFWAFNHYPNLTFERDQLIARLENLTKELRWPQVAYSTLKKDVACFIRTYAVQPSTAKAKHDDSLESPLTELGLLKPINKRDGFSFVRGPKSTLSGKMVVYALIEFWREYSSSTALSVESIAYEPGSPGRVFLLDENDVIDRLTNIDEVTDSRLTWNETAGLKQVVQNPDFGLSSGQAFQLIKSDYL